MYLSMRNGLSQNIQNIRFERVHNIIYPLNKLYLNRVTVQ